MRIRTASMADLDTVTDIEAACFPAAEAASREDFAARLAVYPHHFWLLEEDGRVVSFVNGMVSDEPDLRDEMYADASLHRPDGRWQMVFGLNTLPEYRRRGYAGRLVEALVRASRERGKAGVVLTCKDRLVPYYASFGFADEGLSSSTHGNVAWHQMRLTFHDA